MRGCRAYPASKLQGEGVDRFLHPRKGRLRGQLRTGQPAGMGGDPAQRHPARAGQGARGHRSEGGDRERMPGCPPPSPDVEAIVAGAPRRPVRLSRHARGLGRALRAGLPARRRGDRGRRQRQRRRSPRTAERIHPAGLFVASMRRPAASRSAIACACGWGGHEQEFDDVYRFPPVLGELDMHLLVEGNHLASYRKLGAHPIVHDGVEGDRLRGLGAQRAPGQRGRRFQRLGRPAHADAPASRRRVLGDLRARAAPRPSLQIRAARPRRRRCCR